MKTCFALVAAAGFAGAASAQIQLDRIATIDLAGTADITNTPLYIGNNPSAVWWNGTDAYVGGYNQQGAAAPTGIIRVASALGAPTLGPAFGQVSTANSRGITSLSGLGASVFAALDNGAGNGDSVRSFSGPAGSLNWRIGTAAADSTRRGDGVAVDPGFNGSGPAVSYLAIGSGRRHRLDITAGTYLNGQNAGAIINFAPTSTTWRDVAFDPATGDLYSRESNRVGRAVRNGDNSFVGSASTVLGAIAAAAGVDNQNLEFVSNSAFGSFIIFNDRQTPGAGQSFSSVVKAMDTSGNPLTLSFLNYAPALGNGAYDFSWNAATGTLAITDFQNRQLNIFRIPAPGAASLIAFAGLAAARRRR